MDVIVSDRDSVDGGSLISLRASAIRLASNQLNSSSLIVTNFGTGSVGFLGILFLSQRIRFPLSERTVGVGDQGLTG